MAAGPGKAAHESHPVGTKSSEPFLLLEGM